MKRVSFFVLRCNYLPILKFIFPQFLIHARCRVIDAERYSESAIFEGGAQRPGASGDTGVLEWIALAESNGRSEMCIAN